MNIRIPTICFAAIFTIISTVISVNAANVVTNTCTKAVEIRKNAAKEGFSELLELYANAETEETQWCIAENLDIIDSEGAAAIFVKQLQSGDKQNRLKAAFALRRIHSEKAVPPLHIVLQQQDSEMQCQAAYALGAMRNENSIEPLAKLSENVEPQVASCALEALSWYDDVGFCQDFLEIWLSKRDPAIRKQAGEGFVRIDCDKHVERSGKYALDSKSCGYTQFFINTVQEAVASDTPEKNLKEALKKLKIKETIIDEDTPEEIIQMRLNLVFAVMDWGETASVIHSFENYGSVEQNKLNHLSEIESFALKEEFVKQFCPIISFPEFSYWNTVIEKKSTTAN